jgi:hypothetical protein
MHGQGPRWEAIHSLFDVECRRLGFNDSDDQEEDGGLRGYSPPGEQRSLFET